MGLKRLQECSYHSSSQNFLFCSKINTCWWIYLLRKSSASLLYWCVKAGAPGQCHNTDATWCRSFIAGCWGLFLHSPSSTVWSHCYCSILCCKGCQHEHARPQWDDTTYVECLQNHKVSFKPVRTIFVTFVSVCYIDEIQHCLLLII